MSTIHFSVSRIAKAWRKRAVNWSAIVHTNQRERYKSKRNTYSYILIKETRPFREHLVCPSPRIDINAMLMGQSSYHLDSFSWHEAQWTWCKLKSIYAVSLSRQDILQKSCKEFPQNQICFCLFLLLALHYWCCTQIRPLESNLIYELHIFEEVIHFVDRVARDISTVKV